MKPYLFIVALAVVACQDKSVFDPLYDVTLRNQSGFECIRMRTERTYESIDSAFCGETSSHLGKFPAGPFDYAAFCSDDSLPLNLISEGSIYLSGDMVCIFYDDSVRWRPN